MLRLLLVEDEYDMRRTIIEAFKAAPIEITTAVDGLQALEHIKSGRYNIIVSDINMPNMNGVQLVKKIKTSKLNSGATVIIISASLEKDNIAELQKLGIKNILAKPFKISQIVEIITKAIAAASETPA